LIPRLPDWRERHPDLPLQVIGTDSVVDLHAGEAQLAIRYARLPPEGLVSDKLCEDRHWPACAPTVVPTAGRRKVIDLRGRTLIHAAWLPEDDAAPTWKLAVCCTGGGTERARMERDETPHLPRRRRMRSKQL
jgi:LysR family glycine cleavage system transcriptional activator